MRTSLTLPWSVTILRATAIPRTVEKSAASVPVNTLCRISEAFS